MNQPDFNGLFLKAFEGERTAISYLVRPDSNFPHDIHFLQSLLRNAQFKLKDVRLNENKIEIPVLRECWEIYEEVEKQNVPERSAVLKFDGVTSYRWIIGDTTHIAPFEGSLIDADEIISGETLCGIDGIFIGEATYIRAYSDTEIILYGHPRHWQLRISLMYEGWKIEMRDDLPKQEENPT